MNNSTPEEMNLITIFMDVNKTPEQTCKEIDFEGCEQMKRDYLSEVNTPGGCSSCRKASVRRKYTSFIKPKIKK